MFVLKKARQQRFDISGLTEELNSVFDDDDCQIIGVIDRKFRKEGKENQNIKKGILQLFDDLEKIKKGSVIGASDSLAVDIVQSTANVSDCGGNW
jgi:hypothetical protein